MTSPDSDCLLQPPSRRRLIADAPKDPFPQTVVIIGGGFSGTMVAAHLLQSSPGWASPGLRVCLVERDARLGAGVAYGTQSPLHRLNVPAGKMSAWPGDESHFVRWARCRQRGVTARSFVARSLYAEYLRSILAEARTGARGAAGSFESVAHEAFDVEPISNDGRLRVHLRGRSPIDADRVVLAVGNLAPAAPAFADDAFCRSGAYVRDPWQPGALDVSAELPLLLLGSGLTMIDCALALDAQGHRSGIVALSRRGLLPQPHLAAGARKGAHSARHAASSLRLAGLDRAPATALGLLRAVRAAVDRGGRRNVDWRDVIGAMREQTPTLWQSLEIGERARFLRHLRPYWDTFRHRVAPEPAQRFAALCASRRVVVRAGRVESARADAGGVTITVRDRRSQELERLHVARVINCTGPGTRIDCVDHTLLRALVGRGLLRPDALGLGVEIGAQGEAIDRHGRAIDSLLVVGPLTRARFWESTAVPELRVQAAAAAERIAARVRQASAVAA